MASRASILDKTIRTTTWKETTMSTSLRFVAVSALLAANVALFAGAAGAAPIGEPRALVNAVPSITQSVQWRAVGDGDGALRRLQVELSRGQSLAVPWLTPTARATTVPAIRLPLRTVLPLETRSLTACSVSSHTIQAAALISGMTVAGTPVLKLLRWP